MLFGKFFDAILNINTLFTLSACTYHNITKFNFLDIDIQVSTFTVRFKTEITFCYNTNACKCFRIKIFFPN